MSSSDFAVSAPGKVLFAGGFLVLDRDHTGLVFGLNARIYVHIQKWDAPIRISTDEPPQPSVLVQSPQFKDARWLYKINPSKPLQDEAVSVIQLTDKESYTKSGNKFVQVTLQYVLTYLLSTSHNINKSTKVTILADNDYYSQGLAGSTKSRRGFKDFGVSLSNAHKTGLGSSAALVSSLVSSLLGFYTGSTDLNQKLVHNLAQAAHCAAQGKVGSGFDIAAAVYGSCLYRRFTPTILETVGEPTGSGFGERLCLCVQDLNPERQWDVEVSSQAVQIPESLLLVMCDVDCGSETPGMVRQVLQWKKDKPAEANSLWTAIQQNSDKLCAELGRLSDLKGISMTDQQGLCDIITEIRALVRDMSKKSGVPIEPDVITELLDYCTGLPGVVGGVAPGAGGYDAVALLIRNDVETLRDLEARLEHWTSKEETTGATIGKVRLLGVKQAREGIRIEDPKDYLGWAQ